MEQTQVAGYRSARLIGNAVEWYQDARFEFMYRKAIPRAKLSDNFLE
jgi:hypothetical protein